MSEKDFIALRSFDTSQNRYLAVVGEGEDEHLEIRQIRFWFIGRLSRWLGLAYNDTRIEKLTAYVAKTIGEWKKEDLPAISRVIEKLEKHHRRKPLALLSLMEKIADTFDLLLKSYYKEKGERFKNQKEFDFYTLSPKNLYKEFEYEISPRYSYTKEELSVLNTALLVESRKLNFKVADLSKRQVQKLPPEIVRKNISDFSEEQRKFFVGSQIAELVCWQLEKMENLRDKQVMRFSTVDLERLGSHVSMFSKDKLLVLQEKFSDRIIGSLHRIQQMELDITRLPCEQIKLIAQSLYRNKETIEKRVMWYEKVSKLYPKYFTKHILDNIEYDVLKKLTPATIAQIDPITPVLLNRVWSLIPNLTNRQLSQLSTNDLNLLYHSIIENFTVEQLRHLQPKLSHSFLHFLKPSQLIGLDIAKLSTDFLEELAQKLQYCWEWSNLEKIRWYDTVCRESVKTFNQRILKYLPYHIFRYLSQETIDQIDASRLDFFQSTEYKNRCKMVPKKSKVAPGKVDATFFNDNTPVGQICHLILQLRAQDKDRDQVCREVAPKLVELELLDKDLAKNEKKVKMKLLFLLHPDKNFGHTHVAKIQEIFQFVND